MNSGLLSPHRVMVDLVLCFLHLILFCDCVAEGGGTNYKGADRDARHETRSNRETNINSVRKTFTHRKRCNEKGPETKNDKVE